jgi:hypothetical protein
LCPPSFYRSNNIYVLVQDVRSPILANFGFGIGKKG